MLIVGLFVYAACTALVRAEAAAADLESRVLLPLPLPLSAGFLFGAGDWRQRSSSPYRNQYKPFRFVNDLKILYRRVGDEDCRVCYGAEDCFVMNHARCEYYAYTAEIVDPEEPADTLDTAPELKFEIDSMLYNLVDRASGDPRYTDCIPLLSRYTDCTKDNICLGCKTCECDVEGRWNCTLRARCRPESDLHEIDHRMLQSVIENLKKDQEVVRKKRSEPITQEAITTTYDKIFDDLGESNTEASDWEIKMLFVDPNSDNDKNETDSKNSTQKSKLRFDEIAEWEQEMHLRTKENKSENIVVTPTTTEDIFNYKFTNLNNINIQTDNNYVNSAKYESDYLAFDEVLHNISVESKNFSRRKPMLDINPVDHILDYMTDDEDTTVATEKYIQDMFDNSATQSSFTKLDKTAVTEAIIENSITEIVIDLLESAKINDNLNYLNDKKINLLDYMDISDKLNASFPKPRPDNDGFAEINSVNIMKRDVHNLTTSTKFLNVTTAAVTTDKTTANTTSTTITIINQTNLTKQNIFDLNKKVVNPLTDILDQKEKEIQELTKIRTNLIIFLDNLKIGKVNFSYTDKNETFLNNYKQQVITKVKGDIRTSNMTLKDKYSLKLKRDVYEVIKDIVGIQKLSDPKKLPDDLKFLIRAMKHYVHKQGFHINNKVKKENFRRRWNTDRAITYDPIRENVVKILEVIDRDMPLSTGLYALSGSAKKILKRIIKQNYIDEFAMIGLRVYDPNYNLTNDLRNIGTKWKKMMDGISASPPSDELYTTKLLHLELSVDISKMNDALSLINFAHRRSMVPVDEVIGEEIISEISDSLDKINKKIINVVHQGARTIKRRTKYWSSWQITTTKSTVPKMSFLQQIKSLLHNSKRDIMDLIRKKVPKSDVLKELARKQLDINKNKLSEYERTMSSWQHNFGALPNNVRERRGSDFADRRDRNRIKNIIPRYLRGKVHPAINNKSHKKSKFRKSNKNTGHKTKISSTSTSTSRTSTYTSRTSIATSSSSTTTSSSSKIASAAVTLTTTTLKPSQTSSKP